MDFPYTSRNLLLIVMQFVSVCEAPSKYLYSQKWSDMSFKPLRYRWFEKIYLFNWQKWQFLLCFGIWNCFSAPCAYQSLHCSLLCNAEFALHMEGSHSDFALHMERRHIFRNQQIAKIAMSDKKELFSFKPPIS